MKPKGKPKTKEEHRTKSSYKERPAGNMHDKFNSKSMIKSTKKDNSGLINNTHGN